MPTNIAKWVLDLHRNCPPHQPFCVLNVPAIFSNVMNIEYILHGSECGKLNSYLVWNGLNILTHMRH